MKTRVGSGERQIFLWLLLLGVALTLIFFCFDLMMKGWHSHSPFYLLFALVSGVIFGSIVYFVFKNQERAFFYKLSEMTRKKIGFSLYARKNMKEFGNQHEVIMKSYNDFLDKIFAIIGQIRTSSDKVLSLAEELSASTEEINSTTQEISATVQNMATTAEKGSREMVEIINIIQNLINSIVEVANNASEAVEIVNSANLTAKKGSRTAVELVEKMNHLSNSVDDTSTIIKGLEGKSKEINNIVKVIGKIAEKTNRLALNAAIEAARAGDAGKGFAVVSDDIRQLAEGSKQATSKITEIITSIQKETTSAVTAMENNIDETTDGKETINKSKTVLDDIASVVDQSTVKIKEISSSTEMQKAGTNTVVKFLHNMRTLTENNAAGTEEVSASIQEQTSAMQNIASTSQKLAEEALQLRNLLVTFNVASNREMLSDAEVKTGSEENKMSFDVKGNIQ